MPDDHRQRPRAGRRCRALSSRARRWAPTSSPATTASPPASAGSPSRFRPQGRLTVDAGRAAALTRAGQEPAALGRRRGGGRLRRRRVVAVAGRRRAAEFARGLVNFDAAELRKYPRRQDRGHRAAARLQERRRGHPPGQSGDPLRVGLESATCHGRDGARTRRKAGGPRGRPRACAGRSARTHA